MATKADLTTATASAATEHTEELQWASRTSAATEHNAHHTHLASRTCYRARAARWRTVVNPYCQHPFNMPREPFLRRHLLRRIAAHAMPDSSDSESESTHPSMPEVEWSGVANAANANANDDTDPGISTATQNADDNDIESIKSFDSFSTCSEVVVYTADDEHIVNAQTF